MIETEDKMLKQSFYDTRFCKSIPEKKLYWTAVN